LKLWKLVRKLEARNWRLDEEGVLKRQDFSSFELSVSRSTILFISSGRFTTRRGGSGGRRGERPAERKSEDGIPQACLGE
jgi:hypothetical protein